MAVAHEPPITLDGPWMADKRWASGRISDGGMAGVVVIWVFALLWNAITTVGLVFAYDQIRAKGGVAYVGLFFPAFGLLLLLAAVGATLQRLTFGKSHLDLETLPGCVGGWFAGTVRASPRLRDAEIIDLGLRCVRCETRGSGDDRSTSENTLWEEEQALTGRLATGSDGAVELPVSFRIPADCLPTSGSASDGIAWRLRIRAEMPGTDYSADFTVPVFQAAQPDGFVPSSERAAAKVRASHAVVSAMDDPQIYITANAAGRRRFVFPAGRNRKTAMVLSAFFAAVGGVSMITATFDAPWLVTAILALVAIPIAYAAGLYWFRHVELSVDRHGIDRDWRWLGITGSRTIDAGDLVEIKKRVTTQVGDTPFYTIFAVAQGGKEISLISNLRTRDAGHVEDQINAALGRAPKS